MPKIKTAENAPDYHYFHCPGCDSHHAFSTPPWTFNGDYEKPTIRNSILVNQGSANPTAPVCHSWVTDGSIQFLTDCTHAMAGQTVELPDVEAWPY